MKQDMSHMKELKTPRTITPQLFWIDKGIYIYIYIYIYILKIENKHFSFSFNTIFHIRRRGIAVIPKTQNGHLTNANAFPNSNANEKWSVPPPLHTNGSAGGSVKSLLAPTTISSKMKATLSVQTVQNVTFLLNNLLQQYDNSLRPDLGGKIRNKRTPYVEYTGIYRRIFVMRTLRH